MDVFRGNAVAVVVVPDGKHTAFQLRMLLGDRLSEECRRRPRFVEPFAIQVVVIIAGSRHDVVVAVGDGKNAITEFHHRVGLGVIG